MLLKGLNLTPKDLINKINRFFRSLRLTAIVISLLTGIYFLGLVLPQKWMFETRDLYNLWRDSSIVNRVLDAIGFTEIYLSPLTIVLLTLFFINLLVVTLHRVPVMLRRAYLTGDIPSFDAARLKSGRDTAVLHTEIEHEGIERKLRTFFSDRRWYFRNVSDASGYIAVKNRLSPIGFLLFHLSFFLCLIGGLTMMYTRFSGYLPLTEGQSFDGDIQQFRIINKEPRIFKRLGSLNLYVEKVQPFYEREIPTELVVSLQARYRDRTSREVLRINEPMHTGPMSILVQSIGVSPLFIMRSPAGKEIDAAFVSLNVLGGEEDMFQFDTDRRFSFNVKFFPDYVKEDGYETTRSIEMKNPAMRLVVGKENEIIYTGTIRQGERADLENYTISFEDIRYWTEFLVVREYGKAPLITGFIFASIGLIMRLVFYQKRLRLSVEHEKGRTSLFIDGKSEYFPHSFEDERDKLVQELDAYLNVTNHHEIRAADYNATI